MPITVDMMKQAAASGLSVVCASCTKYWNARDKGIQGHACLAEDDCRSPFAGGDFHEYEGPITEDRFRVACFVCGADATKAVRKAAGSRALGLCSDHWEWMIDPSMQRARRVHLTTVPKRNYLDVDESTLRGRKLPPEKSLLGRMLKTEKEWADREGAEFKPLELMGIDPDA